MNVSSQDLLTYIGIALGLSGIIATIYYAVKYAEKKKPRFAVESERKIVASVEAPGDIRISFRGKNVSRVTSTTVWFWNAGKRPIRSDDVPPTQSIEIMLDDGSASIEILDVDVRRMSRPGINFSAATCAPNRVRLGFDFLDFSDGAVVEIQHTGKPTVRVSVAGVILGAPEGIRGRDTTKGYPLRRLLALAVPPSAHKRVQRSPLARLIVSLVFIALFGGVALFMLQAGKDITTSSELLRSSLKPFLTGQALNQAVDAVHRNGKYQTLNSIFPYVMAGLLLLNLAAGLMSVWIMPYPFPKTLLEDDAGRVSVSAIAGTESPMPRET